MPDYMEKAIRREEAINLLPTDENRRIKAWLISESGETIRNEPETWSRGALIRAIGRSWLLGLASVDWRAKGFGLVFQSSQNVIYLVETDPRKLMESGNYAVENIRIRFAGTPNADS